MQLERKCLLRLAEMSKQIHRNKMKRKPDGWRDGKPTFRRVTVSAAFIHQLGPVDTAVRDPAGSHQNPMARSTAEVASAAHRTIVFSFRVSQLETQPEARGKVSCANVADGAHLIGTN